MLVKSCYILPGFCSFLFKRFRFPFVLLAVGAKPASPAIWTSSLLVFVVFVSISSISTSLTCVTVMSGYDFDGCGYHCIVAALTALQLRAPAPTEVLLLMPEAVAAALAEGTAFRTLRYYTTVPLIGGIALPRTSIPYHCGSDC